MTSAGWQSFILSPVVEDADEILAHPAIVTSMYKPLHPRPRPASGMSLARVAPKEGIGPLPERGETWYGQLLRLFRKQCEGLLGKLAGWKSSKLMPTLWQKIDPNHDYQSTVKETG